MPAPANEIFFLESQPTSGSKQDPESYLGECHACWTKTWLGPGFSYHRNCNMHLNTSSVKQSPHPQKAKPWTLHDMTWTRKPSPKQKQVDVSQTTTCYIKFKGFEANHIGPSICFLVVWGSRKIQAVRSHFPKSAGTDEQIFRRKNRASAASPSRTMNGHVRHLGSRTAWWVHLFSGWVKEHFEHVWQLNPLKSPGRSCQNCECVK